MNRRHFLAGLAAFAIAPTVLPPRPKVNPAWVSAPYEAWVLYETGSIQDLANRDADRLAHRIAEFEAMPSPWLGMRFAVDPSPIRCTL